MLTRLSTILVTASLATAGLLHAQQPLSLSAAMARADSHAYANRMATADGRMVGSRPRRVDAFWAAWRSPSAVAIRLA